MRAGLGSPGHRQQRWGLEPEARLGGLPASLKNPQGRPSASDAQAGEGVQGGPAHGPHHCGAQLPRVGCLTLPRGLVRLSRAPWGPGARDTGRASCEAAGVTCTPSCLLPHGWIRFPARKRGAPSQPWGPPGASLWSLVESGDHPSRNVCSPVRHHPEGGLHLV